MQREGRLSRDSGAPRKRDGIAGRRVDPMSRAPFDESKERATKMSSPEFYRTVSFFPVIDRESCTLCMACVRACGLMAIGYSSGEGIVTRKGLCRNCRKCVQACASGAVRITAELKGSGLGLV